MLQLRNICGYSSPGLVAQGIVSVSEAAGFSDEWFSAKADSSFLESPRFGALQMTPIGLPASTHPSRKVGMLPPWQELSSSATWLRTHRGFVDFYRYLLRQVAFFYW